MSQLDRDRVIILAFNKALVDLQAGGHDTPLDCDLPAAELVNCIEEPPLNPALVNHDLLETADAGNGVRDTRGAADNALLVGVPETDLQHVVYLDPCLVTKSEAIEDLQSTTLQAVCRTVENLETTYRKLVLIDL